MHILPLISQVPPVSFEDRVGRRISGWMVDEVVADAQEASGELNYPRGEEIE